MGIYLLWDTPHEPFLPSPFLYLVLKGTSKRVINLEFCQLHSTSPRYQDLESIRALLLFPWTKQTFNIFSSFPFFFFLIFTSTFQTTKQEMVLMLLCWNLQREREIEFHHHASFLFHREKPVKGVPLFNPLMGQGPKRLSVLFSS